MGRDFGGGFYYMHPPSIRLGWFFTENYSTRSKSYELRLLEQPGNKVAYRVGT